MVQILCWKGWDSLLSSVEQVYHLWGQVTNVWLSELWLPRGLVCYSLGQNPLYILLVEFILSRIDCVLFCGSSDISLLKIAIKYKGFVGILLLEFLVHVYQFLILLHNLLILYRDWSCIGSCFPEAIYIYILGSFIPFSKFANSDMYLVRG